MPPPPVKACNSKVFGNKCAFTLAETLIVLTILGVIAAITVPSVVKRHMEAIDRTKLKKSMAIYDYNIQKMAIENDLKSDTALKNWSEEKENCGNTTVYFKKSSGEGCEFKTADNVYWDITDIMNPVVALSKDAMDKYKSTGETDGSKSFKFVTSYDPNTGAFRSNDLKYEEQLALETGDKEALEELSDLYNYYNKNNKISKCTDCTIWEYVDMGKYVKNTYKNGILVRSGSTQYEYDEDGKKIASITYDSQGNILDKTTYEYDSQSRVILEKRYNGNSTTPCPNSGCIIAYEYDSKGNVIKRKEGVGGSARDPFYNANIYNYTYNEKNQLIKEKQCGSGGKTCSFETVYEYDSHGNISSEKLYSFYDSSTYQYNSHNLLRTYNYERIYDDTNGNLIAEKTYINGSLTNNIEYQYDSNNNKISTKANGYKTEYKYNTEGHIISSKHYNKDGLLASESKTIFASDGTPITCYKDTNVSYCYK